MREIITHKVNGLNDAIRVTATDGPGPGGANHEYELHLDPAKAGADVSCTTLIRFQNGAIQEVGFNGLSNEAVLAVVADRLEGFQSGPFACEANRIALRHVQAAMAVLRDRTCERMSRGVEGRLEK